MEGYCPFCMRPAVAEHDCDARRAFEEAKRQDAARRGGLVEKGAVSFNGDHGPEVVVAKALRGLSPDAPTYVNEKGGKQSQVPYDFTCLDPKAMFRLAEVMKYGADKYGRDNWRNITPEENANHLMGHLYAWLQGDKSDDHAGHVLARAMMFLASVLADDT